MLTKRTRVRRPKWWFWNDLHGRVTNGTPGGTNGERRARRPTILMT